MRGSASVGCNYEASTLYFIDSLRNPKKSYKNDLNDAFDGNDEVPLRGDLNGRKGDSYCDTNAEPPYSKENEF